MVRDAGPRCAKIVAYGSGCGSPDHAGADETRSHHRKRIGVWLRILMGMNLLESKLQIPVQPQRIVSRPRLRTTLEHQIARHKLTLVSAPAGYGKTTLLADWARLSSLPVAWLSITGEEEDEESFLRYLVAAWETVQPEIIDTPLGILLGSQTPDIKDALIAFIHAGEQAPNHVAFVLDDYHSIEDDAIHDALNFLLDHLPHKLHFILASRSDPPLRLARYRARGQLLEIRADDLHFTREETADFLNRSMELGLLPHEISSLHAETEGWAAGLQLAALTLRRRHRPQRLPAVSGRQRFIADYLREDVLDHLPSDVQDFLLKTSILDSLCGSLCDAVTGKQNGQTMLESLERENLFITPLDHERTWFRIHPLFAEFLRSELDRRFPGEAEELHRRASAWFNAHDLPEQAFRHAVAGDHAEGVIEILNTYLQAKLVGGEFKVVERWIEALPAAWFEAYPVLDLMRAALLASAGAFEACVRLVDDVERRLAPAEREEKRWQLARVLAMRCFFACIQNDMTQAEVYADRALRELSDEDVGFRPGIYGALGDSYRRNRRWEEARECYLKALEVTHSPTVRTHSVHVFGALADLELRQGRLQNASGYWKKALAATQEREIWGRLPLPVIGWVYIRMGELLYEWNQLEDAWDHLSRGLERAELGGDLRALIAGYLIAARLKLTEGDIEAASEHLEKARSLVDRSKFPEWISQFERFQLEFWLAQDRLRAAVNWSDEMTGSAALEDRPESVVVRLAIARVLIVKGDGLSLANAQTLLKQLLETAEQEGQTRITIEGLALKSLASWRLGERAAAMTSLERALRLAEPEGYVRLFADLGLPMARLLQEALSREVMPDYGEKLLAAFRDDLSLVKATAAPLPEPLTDREQEVLKLIAAGLTNREVAEVLVVSPETVKKHTSNIYGKLGVGNRTEAAARGRELDLLG